MTINRLLLTNIFALLLCGQAVLAHKFGSEPHDDVLAAAQSNSSSCSLPPDKLVAYILSPTWWEVTGSDNENINRTPSPMTLSRGDNSSSLLYPPGQSGAAAPHHRIFWHPGIGSWQLDDSGLGSFLSIGKFNTWDTAHLLAGILSERLCESQTASYIFSDWFGCGSGRSLCLGTANDLYNPSGPPAHTIERDDEVGRYGGTQVRTCRLAGSLASFVCYYVNPEENAEGYEGTWIYSLTGATPPNTPSPLSLPFYVYREDSAGGPYEWRYWLDADTGFDTDYAAKRPYGSNSRSALTWETDAENSIGLCDLTTLRGNCGVCTPNASANGMAASCVPPEIPTVITNPASNPTQQSATLNLSVNPKGANTTVWFEWGTTSGLGQETSPHQSVGAGTTSIPVSVTLSGLTCNKTYYFRARAQNTVGSAPPGQILPFETDPCDGGGSGTTDLVRNGDFGDDSDFWTRSGDFYADDRFDNHHDGRGYAYLSKFNGDPGNSLIGTIYQEVTIPASATSATLTFWTKITTSEPSGGPAEDFLNATLKDDDGDFRASLRLYSNQDASSGYVKRQFDLDDFIGETVRIHFLGTTNGDTQPTVFRIDDVSLEVDVPAGGPPEATTNAADQVSSSSARLNMTVDPNGADTEIWFDLEPGDSTPSDDTEHINIGAGSGDRTASISVFGLECGTKYYFRAHAENGHDRADGNVRDFTTSACSGGAPHADTDPAENITQTSARLTADVDPNGLSTQAWFAWGESPNLGQETPHVSVGSGTGNVDFSQTLSGLTCDTTYYFENHAQNSADHDDGVTLEFTTDSCDAPSPSDELLLFASRQACAETEPAVLLGWTMPQGADPLVTIRRSDAQYVATVNTGIKGPVHEVDSGLIFGNVYRFTVEAHVGGATLISNELTVPIASDECRLPVAAGDLPHRPVFWAMPAFCENGVAKVELQWTEAAGAQSYSVQRVGAFIPSATYDGITGTSFVDSGLTPGGGAAYKVSAHNSSGSISSWDVGVVVPGIVCSTVGAPESFSAGVENLICDSGQGAMTLRWSQSSGAASSYRIFEFYDHHLGTLHDNEEDFVDELRHHNPGTVMRAVVQAESASAPGKFREAYPLAQLIPLDVCGGSTTRPTFGGASASYIRPDQALLKVGITANGSDTSAYFEWGTSTAYGFQTTTRLIGNRHSDVTLGEVLTGLSCGTTYHFRTVAFNAHGTTEGADQTFSTPSCGPAQCSVSMVSPAGGEMWVKGTPQTIRWNAGLGCVSFAVKLRRAGLYDGSIDINIGAATDEIAWIPEPWRLPGANLQIEVVGVNSGGQGSSALSNNFSIVNPPVLPTLIFEDTMESVTSNWSIAGWGITNYRAHSPTHSRTAVYGNNVNTSLITPRIDISGRRAAVLTFWHYCDLADFDSMNVWASTDQGATWTYLRGFVGRRTEWQPVTIDLKNFLGQPSIQISFQFVSDGSLTAEGCYIDDIKIYEPPPIDFYTVTPCRIVDTRQNQSALSTGSVRTFAVAGVCGIPPEARAASFNVTAVGATGGGYMTLFPADQLQPQTSTVSFGAGQTRANNAVLGLSADGRIGAVAALGAGQADLVVDVNGYFAEAESTTVTRYLTQNAPGQVGKDIWTTSVYSYAPGGNTPGGGLDDHRLRVGGWGDSYYSLIEFDLSGLPQHAQTARIELFSTPQPGMTALYLDRITEFWDWRTQGTGSDRERLWWADRPDAVQWRSGTISAPTPGQWYSIDITDLYNAWQAGTYPNYGVQLRPVSTNNTWAEFYSANYVDNPVLRPRLVVEPGTFVPGFSRISDMAAPRHFHCAAKLGNGKVLIAGGYGTGTSNPLSSAELYDPATHTFAPTGSMNVARGRPQCVTLSDGRVLVGGGATAPFTYTNSAEVYNPTTGTFTTVGNMTTPRGEGWHAVAVPGGALLFGGTYEGNFGTATAAADRFDAGSNSFSRVGTLAGARRDYTAQMLSDGTTLLVGGVLRFDLPVSPAAELYNVSTNQPISIGQPNNTPRVRSWSSAVLSGGDVLVTSGAGFPSEIYRKVTRSFEALNGAPTLYAADFGSAVSLSNGTVLLLGYGRASGQGGRIAEIFDPAGGTFTAVGPMAFPSECQGYAATALDDGTVLITGGGTPGNCGQGTPVAEIFNPNDL